MTSAAPLPRRGLFKARPAASTAVVVPASAASAASAAPAAGSAELRHAEAELRDAFAAAVPRDHDRCAPLDQVIARAPANIPPNAPLVDAARVLARALAPGE